MYRFLGFFIGMENMIALQIQAHNVGKSIKEDIKNSLKNNELHVVLQPKISTQNPAVLTPQILGAELLLRWHHPRWGFIPTETWINLAEKNNLLSEITAFITTEAIKLLKNPLFKGLTLSVNVSPACFDNAYAEFVVKTLADAGVKGEQLILEITESNTLNCLEPLIAAVNKVRATGVKIALDDFGIGFSSMKYLIDIPIDIVKIDKEFVQKAPALPVAKVVLSTLISLAKDIGAQVIVEGVETREQYDLVQTMNVDAIQGFFFSKPLNLHEFMLKYLQEKVNVSDDSVWGDSLAAATSIILKKAHVKIKQNNMPRLTA